jgi:hypothetical protein
MTAIAGIALSFGVAAVLAAVIAVRAAVEYRRRRLAAVRASEQGTVRRNLRVVRGGAA